jgi:biopolymer transport protein ExbB
MMVVVFNIWQLILKGGPLMWPIIFLSIVALAVGTERVVFLSRAQKLLKVHEADLMRSLQQDSIKHTLNLCETFNSPFSRIFKSAILKFGNSAEVIKTAMEEIFVYEIHRIKERINILSFALNVSVLMGLLGTVVGLTIVFHAVSIRSNVLNPLSVGDMAQGVWQALFTTVAGLMVSILSFCMYSFCSSRIDDITADLKISMAKVVHILVQLAELNDPQERN